MKTNNFNNKKKYFCKIVFSLLFLKPEGTYTIAQKTFEEKLEEDKCELAEMRRAFAEKERVLKLKIREQQELINTFLTKSGSITDNMKPLAIRSTAVTHIPENRLKPIE